jgi:beta-galactosidase
MVQVENEYGSYGNDPAYLAHLVAGLERRGIEVPLFTADGPSEQMLTGGTVPGVRATLNFGSNPDGAYRVLRGFRPQDPEFCMEFWDGWFDHFGLAHHTRAADEAAKTLDEMLGRGGSVNLYMAHGGTSFGFHAGANHTADGYQPTITSYDYDAPLSEDGRPTAKYWAFREVLAKYAALPLPDVPEYDEPRLPNASLELTSRLPLLACLDRISGGTVDSAAPPSFEELGHSYGLAVYRTRVPGPRGGRLPLSVDGLRDRAHVFVDGAFAGILERDRVTELALDVPSDGVEVTLVVEAMGRVNYGPLVGERKGVTGDVRHAAQNLFGWRTDPVDLSDLSVLPFGSAQAPQAESVAGPAFYRAELHVEEPLDGFLELPDGGKGYIWINGFCLGRYWERGPQRRLYLPWPLLRRGANEIIVLELDRPDGPGPLLVRDEPDLGAEAAPSTPWSWEPAEETV